MQKGTWNAPDANEEKIMALQVEINKLKSKASRSIKKGNKNNPRAKKNKPAWFNSRPSEDTLTTPKEWNGRMWYYCHTDTGGKCEGVWRQHRPSECKGKAHKFNSNEKVKQEKKARPAKRRKTSDDNSKGQRRLKLKKGLEAASALVESDDEYTSSEDN